jgi:hypothetical protein
MANIFTKLEEAQRVYLNPTLDLIQNDVPLHEHCYYKLSKYPTSSTQFWDNLNNVGPSLDLIPLFEWLQEIDTKQYPHRDHLISNLNLAKKKNDITYIQYLQSQQPRRKVQMKLIRKKTIIDRDIGKILGITDAQLNGLTTARLKMAIHKYIRDHELQEDSDVMIDDVLSKLLDIGASSKLHYFDLLKSFNRKFRPHHHDSLETVSDL